MIDGESLQNLILVKKKMNDGRAAGRCKVYVSTSLNCLFVCVVLFVLYVCTFVQLGLML